MIIFGFILVYVFLISLFIVGYNRVQPFTSKSSDRIQSFSMIIPFRNEEAHLPALLLSIHHLDYPVSQVEILMVNDDSSDGSVQLIQNYINKNQLSHIHILENTRQSGSPKKDAIKTAISVSKFSWVITTDADCTLPSKWLGVLDSFIEKMRPNMVAGPLALVETTNTSSFLHAFEILDVHSLLGVTIGAFGLGSPIMANGAHLAYRKDVFFNVKGFDGNDYMASGDDLFLLEKFLAYDAKAVRYLKSKEAIVLTTSHKSWTDFINQRKRWAAKASGFKSNFAKAVGVVVVLGNLSTVIAYGQLLYASFFENQLKHIPLLLVVIIIKYFIDGLLIFRAQRLTGSKKSFIWYPLVALCYPIVTLMISVLAFTTSYTWKDRRFTH
tara:strand:- start:2800 stop:3948 length:1149 start_codon:yes stop_codon:yes gene_type:complete